MPVVGTWSFNWKVLRSRGAGLIHNMQSIYIRPIKAGVVVRLCNCDWCQGRQGCVAASLERDLRRYKIAWVFERNIPFLYSSVLPQTSIYCKMVHLVSQFALLSTLVAMVTAQLGPMKLSLSANMKKRWAVGEKTNVALKEYYKKTDLQWVTIPAAASGVSQPMSYVDGMDLSKVNCISNFVSILFIKPF